MSRKHRDEEVTQQIRVGREALDEALRESEAAAKRVQSSVPPPARKVVHPPAECAACATGVGHTAQELEEIERRLQEKESEKP